jgi:hypothetical protein
MLYSRQRKGILYLYDEDEDYESKVNEYIKECLTPKMEPIILYNGAFNKFAYETKYKSIVENFMIVGKNLVILQKL